MHSTNLIMSLGALLKEKYAQRLILKCEEFTHADGQHRQSACLSPCQSKKDIISAENLFCLSLSLEVMLNHIT